MKRKLSLLLLTILFLACSEKEDQPLESNFSGDSGTFIDNRDNHEYKWIRIGEQIWMAENLAYLPKVNQHTMEDIEAVCPNLDETEPHFHVYGFTGTNVNDAKSTTNYKAYGVLYNWFGSKEACPVGWHIPTNDEWEQLAEFVSQQNGPYEKVNQAWTDTGDNWTGVGKHLKAKYGWESQGNGTDDFGFSALPAGFSVAIDRFDAMGWSTRWWSDTEFSSTDAWIRGVNYGTHIFSNIKDHKIYLYSVRCVRDN